MSTVQTDINIWFDNIYKSKGYDYLRPQEAYEIFVTILSPLQNSNFLDVGCGLGLLLKLMNRKNVKTYGVDLSSEAVWRAREYCREAWVFQANAESLPFEDNFFDYITCIGTLERVINREVAIREQMRVACKNAKFCFMVRNAGHYSWKLLKKPFNLYNNLAHQDALTYDEWQDLFTSCGLRIMSVFPDHWPYLKLLETISAWKRINYSRIRKLPFDPKNAYEFIFLMEKNE